MWVKLSGSLCIGVAKRSSFMWGATRMVSGGHSDPYEVCLPCAGGHQDVHLAVRPSLRLRDMHKKEQIKVCIAGVLRFCLHVLTEDSSDWPEAYFGPFFCLPHPSSPFLCLLIVLAEYLGSPSMRRQSGNAVATAKSIRGAWNAFPAKNFTAVRGGSITSGNTHGLPY